MVPSAEHLNPLLERCLNYNNRTCSGSRIHSHFGWDTLRGFADVSRIKEEMERVGGGGGGVRNIRVLVCFFSILEQLQQSARSWWFYVSQLFCLVAIIFTWQNLHWRQCDQLNGRRIPHPTFSRRIFTKPQATFASNTGQASGFQAKAHLTKTQCYLLIQRGPF